MARRNLRMADKIAPRDRHTRRIGVATALMSALAGGAIWCLLALQAGRDLAALSLPIAGVVVWALRANGYAGRWTGAAIAAGCVALASAYSFYLQATAEVASLLGLPMRTALVRMDPRMAIDIAWAGLDRSGLAIVGLAIVVAICGTRWSRGGARLR
jgi:hypothetical protein